MYSSIFSEVFVKNSLQLFERQFKVNSVYQSFCRHLNKTPDTVKGLHELPFMPIEFFKSHQIYTAPQAPEISFRSSGTTQMELRSVHYIDQISRYKNAIGQCFTDFFGNPTTKPQLFALLPGYLENDNSSLIFMLEKLHEMQLVNLRGYYLNDHKKLYSDLTEAKRAGEHILLWGVTFGLLDFAEQHPIDLKGHIVLETGGMKGRRREMTRAEVHEILTKAFGVSSVYSEYGMTELLSQAYSSGQGIFAMNRHLGILVRDVYDPLQILEPEKTGVINVIDLNNEHSCAFIATQDVGRYYRNETFEVLGRTDSAEVRGCNLMAL